MSYGSSDPNHRDFNQGRGPSNSNYGGNQGYGGNNYGNDYNPQNHSAPNRGGMLLPFFI